MKRVFTVVLELDDGQDPDGWADTIATALDGLEGGRVAAAVSHRGSEDA